MDGALAGVFQALRNLLHRQLIDQPEANDGLRLAETLRSVVLCLRPVSADDPETVHPEREHLDADAQLLRDTAQGQPLPEVQALEVGFPPVQHFHDDTASRLAAHVTPPGMVGKSWDRAYISRRVCLSYQG